MRGYRRFQPLRIQFGTLADRGLQKEKPPRGSSRGGQVLGGQGEEAYCRSFRAFWGCEFAMPRTLVAACTRIWLRVRLAVSAAKSASLIDDSAAVVFSTATPRERT